MLTPLAATAIGPLESSEDWRDEMQARFAAVLPGVPHLPDHAHRPRVSWLIQFEINLFVQQFYSFHSELLYTYSFLRAKQIHNLGYPAAVMEAPPTPAVYCRSNDNTGIGAEETKTEKKSRKTTIVNT